jgi:2-iminobutanoate/2-iminopropanoate deaminase
MDQARRTVTAPAAPAAIGPYSHAVRAGQLLFCSGQIPLDPATGEIVVGGAAAQARQCLENLEAVCAAAGTDLGSAVKVTVYMTELEKFGEVNEVYAEFFAEDPPARVTVGVAALPKGAEVEIDAVVALGQGEAPGGGASEAAGGQPTTPPAFPALASTDADCVYHVELRHFPRNVCRFNMTAEELRAAVLEPWAADRPFEMGEMRWDPRQARLTVIASRPIPPEQLSMGRGWSTAQRVGQDVTAQVTGAAGGARGT